MFTTGEDSILLEAVKPGVSYPQMRYMGSKHKLIEWINEHVADLKFETALDAFSGSGVVSYYFKRIGKQVYTNDFLNFPHIFTKATVENQNILLTSHDIKILFSKNPSKKRFIEKTFSGIFFEPSDLKFLDLISSNLGLLKNQYKEAIALSALIRSCIKKQPRGVFTISSSNPNHIDGRRDLKLSMEDHFLEQIAVFNSLVFNNHKQNRSFTGDIFEFDTRHYPVDLVYLDPPYVPLSDDNCYIKRYHFLEGLSVYWNDLEIMHDTKVKKIRKKFTPFSYKSTVVDAFERLFYKFKESVIVLSYSSNAYPDLDTLLRLLNKQKKDITVHKKVHRYHFGNHAGVDRAIADEYLIIGK